LNEWQANGHPGFQNQGWNMAELEAFEEGGGSMSDFLKNCINTLSDEDEAKVTEATQSYCNATEDPIEEKTSDDEPQLENEELLPNDEDIILDRVGLVNANDVAPDREELSKRAAEALLVGHDTEPQNTYGNPQYWVKSMPWLFPFGSGGAEASRPSEEDGNELSLSQWVHHCLNFYDDRFRKDPAFIFVVYKVLQIRDRVTKTRVMCKKIFNSRTHQATNAASVSDLKKALEILTEKNSLYGATGDEIKRLKDLIRSLKMVGSKSADSIYARDACRSKMMGLVTYYGLPAVFVTINLSDISNPTVSFWHNSMETEFNLDTLIPDFPTSSQRAKMVADDPVHAAEMFHVHIKAFLKAFFGWKAPSTDGLQGPLLNKTIFTGDQGSGCQAFFGTVECQGRGSLHLHLLAWLAGLPSPKELIRRLNEFCAVYKSTPAPCEENNTEPQTEVSESPLVDRFEAWDMFDRGQEDQVDCASDPEYSGMDHQCGEDLLSDVHMEAMDDYERQFQEECNRSILNEDFGEQIHLSDYCVYHADDDDPTILLRYLDLPVYEHRHRNAVGDGRCSLFAAADVLCATIAETVRDFKIYTQIRIKELENMIMGPMSHPCFMKYLTTERLSPNCTSTDAQLWARWKFDQFWNLREHHASAFMQ
jgi:hypothetical protein